MRRPPRSWRSTCCFAYPGLWQDAGKRASTRRQGSTPPEAEKEMQPTPESLAKAAAVQSPVQSPVQGDRGTAQLLDQAHPRVRRIELATHGWLVCWLGEKIDFHWSRKDNGCSRRPSHVGFSSGWHRFPTTGGTWVVPDGKVYCQNGVSTPCRPQRVQLNLSVGVIQHWNLGVEHHAVDGS